MNSITSRRNTSTIETFLLDFSGVLANFFNGAGKYFSAAQAERELRYLDDRMLADIGLNRSDIAYAVRKGKTR